MQVAVETHAQLFCCGRQGCKGIPGAHTIQRTRPKLTPRLRIRCRLALRCLLVWRSPPLVLYIAPLDVQVDSICAHGAGNVGHIVISFQEPGE